MGVLREGRWKKKRKSQGWWCSSWSHKLNKGWAEHVPPTEDLEKEGGPVGHVSQKAEEESIFRRKKVAVPQATEGLGNVRLENECPVEKNKEDLKGLLHHHFSCNVG